MKLRDKIESQYKNAIKSKDTIQVNTFRMIKSAIKDKDIENRTSDTNELINEQKILILLQNLIKQRKDSIDSFKNANRDDLIEKEQEEINIISQFLPSQLNEDETKKIIEKIINENNLSSIQDMGKLMGILKTHNSGSVDMALAGKIAKSLLNN